MTLVVTAVVAIVVAGAVAVLGGTSEGATPSDDQYVKIEDVATTVERAPRRADASTGTFSISCGNNADRHLNADNPVMSAGTPAGAHHTHEYVGNKSADYRSTNESLAASQTTCDNGDLSAYFWPVLRLTDTTGHDEHAAGGGTHGNTGEVVPPKQVKVEYRGNPASKVLPMPRFLRMITGDPMAYTHDYGDRVRAKWSCTSHPERHTTKYPICDNGGVVRTFEFASCWDGGNVDSASHRTHVVFPSAGGVCPAKTFPVPQLRLTVTYDVPEGRPFAIDSFPDQLRDPASDHAMFINVMPASMMNELVRCVNEGRSCSSDH